MKKHSPNYSAKYDSGDEEGGISKLSMSILADHIEEYLEVYKNIFIVPDSLKHSRKVIDEAFQVSEELIRKLRKGKTSVFKDSSEWNSD